MRTLTLSELKAVTCGAVRIEDQTDGCRFYRFSQEQEAYYAEKSEMYYSESFATAGVKLYFKTESEQLKLFGEAKESFSGSCYSFDLVVDGAPLAYLDNFSDFALERDYTKQTFPVGKFEKVFELGAGEKTVSVYFPWAVIPTLSVAIDDAATITPMKPPKKLLAYGDSITQGFNALRPSKRYASQLADLLDAEEFNRGIGGEVICPKMLSCFEAVSPDYITVAYGTNDWCRSDADTFKKDCRAFYQTLCQKYPKAKIFAITPIWRKDHKDNRPLGLFEEVAQMIGQTVDGLPNVTLIRGADFVPKDENYYADLVLHPNDAGFTHYAENLYKAMKGYL